jgi:hypothetical protein
MRWRVQLGINSTSDHDFFCVGVMYSGEYDACDVTLSVYPHRASVRFPPWSGIFFKLAQCGYTLRVTSQASYRHLSPFIIIIYSRNL